jgi:hypothetical protein
LFQAHPICNEKSKYRAFIQRFLLPEHALQGLAQFLSLSAVLERYFVIILDSGFIHNKKEEWGKIGIVCSFLGSFSALLF